MAMYQKEFVPVVKMGENYSIITAQGTEKYFECVYVEGLPPSLDLIYDGGSLASGATDSANKITITEMEGSAKTETDISEVFQLRMRILDDTMIVVKLPAAQSKWKTRNDEIRMDFNTEIYDPTLATTETYIYEDDTIYIDIYNPTNYTLSQTRIAFFGWRIVGRQLSKAPEKYTRLVATGFSR